ncbi:hypothetical protein E3N88_38069 [Mikania micrantha]|uniref:Uncharacterized protein n=1 Tax=Mikania micrantha TaxID=192012 RepID=A0A5N6LVE2_9ASTR|nr:hypothetical protein E3N88_38069 [Mikania micrantha]
MRYMKLHKFKFEENDHAFVVENKRASNDDQKVKRMLEAAQKILTAYKDRQWDFARNVRRSDRQAKAEAKERIKVGEHELRCFRYLSSGKEGPPKHSSCLQAGEVDATYEKGSEWVKRHVHHVLLLPFTSISTTNIIAITT